MVDFVFYKELIKIKDKENCTTVHADFFKEGLSNAMQFSILSKFELQTTVEIFFLSVTRLRDYLSFANTAS